MALRHPAARGNSRRWDNAGTTLALFQAMLVGFFLGSIAPRAPKAPAAFAAWLLGNAAVLALLAIAAGALVLTSAGRQLLGRPRRADQPTPAAAPRAERGS